MNRKINIDLDLTEEQYTKLCIVARSLKKEPEEVLNNVVCGYLAIVEIDPTDDEKITQ